MKLDVVGAQEAAQILGVELGRIWRWRKQGRMPPRVADLKATPVWQRKDVMAVAKRLRASGKKKPPVWDGRAAPPLEVELIGLREVALMLGLLREDAEGHTIWKDLKAIGRWRAAGTFPEPLLDKRDFGQAWKPGRGLAATPLWDRADIEAFAQTRANAAEALAEMRATPVQA